MTVGRDADVTRTTRLARRSPDTQPALPVTGLLVYYSRLTLSVFDWDGPTRSRIPFPTGRSPETRTRRYLSSEVIWLEVFVKENESLERALRRFKRKVQRSGLYSELRKRRFYEKPSAQRKRKKEAAIRRERRRQRRIRR